jgi:hypothetical protein
MNLSKDCKVSQVLGYFAAGTTLRTSSIIDMQDYEGVMFIACLGTLIAGGTLDVYAQENTANATSGMARIPASTTPLAVTAGMAAMTQSCILVDIFQPNKEFIQCNIAPATQNAVILGIVAIQYRGKFKPSTQDASVIGTNFFQSPAET